jgi:hypothetical protein
MRLGFALTPCFTYSNLARIALFNTSTVRPPTADRTWHDVAETRVLNLYALSHRLEWCLSKTYKGPRLCSVLTIEQPSICLYSRKNLSQTRFNKSYLLVIATFLFLGLAVEGVPAPYAVVKKDLGQLNLKRGEELLIRDDKKPEFVANLY